MHRISTKSPRARPLLGTLVDTDVADADEIHAQDAGGAAFAALLQRWGQPSWVVRAQSSTVADAFTKVVMIAGARAAASLDHYRASAIFVSADGDVHATTNRQGVGHAS